MKKYLQKLGQDSYKASLEKVDTKTKNKVLLKFSYLIKKNLNKPNNFFHLQQLYQENLLLEKPK